MSRFWVYIGDKVQGPVDIPSLRKVPGFNLLSQVCEEGEQTWRMADEVIEIKSYFISPPRPNSFALDAGNAAPKIDFAPQPMLEELTLPEPNTAWQKSATPAKSGGPDIEILLTDEPKKNGAVAPAPVGNAALRAICDVCGYKNPRDVEVCMKCGEKLKGNAIPALSSPKVAIEDAAPQASAAPTPAPIAAAPAAVDPVSNTMVEISMLKLVIGVAAAILVTGGSFFGYRSWKKRHTPKGLPAVGVPITLPAPMHKAVSHSARRVVQGYHWRPARHRMGYNAAALPGVSKYAAHATENSASEPKTEGASYHVVAEAAPLKKRYSSPVNSPYAVKRRANQGLWTSQEDQAIGQVQRDRIYGGQRTVERNVEILMQILRDREYNTAFESGKRIYLYNDVDWSATLKEGPVYEVRLTFSGGQEPDGSPKKPLHFAFSSDLERGTVEPGGEDQVRSNTLHAFFDESRIAPEDRRAIAKDTEELVLAAQPEASPLALDTVVRQFAKVYTTAALSRVADAYDLMLVKKKLAHDTRLGSDDMEPAATTVLPVKSDTPAQTTNERAKPAEQAQSSKSIPLFAPSKGGGADFRMESGSGREKTFLVRATSRASVNRIWEILTGYDRLKQFMPDMLASEREGQDGAATIVHMVCLTRFTVFMFKVNLHLRVIEHPREHNLEFERIAGEFESFRGSVEVTTDPATHDSQIAFHATVVPSGHTMGWVMDKMARRLLVPQIEAIRAKAESN